MLDGPVRARELGKIMSSHFRFDFHRVEHLSRQNHHWITPAKPKPTHLAVVYSNNTANHLRYDNHITEMGLDDCRLFIGWGLLLGLAQFLDETHWAAFETALEPTAGTGMDELQQMLDSDNSYMAGISYFDELLNQMYEDMLSEVR